MTPVRTNAGINKTILWGKMRTASQETPAPSAYDNPDRPAVAYVELS